MIVSLPAAAHTQQPIRVNCGGPSYTDSLGHVWEADYGYNEGTASTVSAKITGTSDPALYQDGRWNGNPHFGADCVSLGSSLIEPRFPRGRGNCNWNATLRTGLKNPHPITKTDI